MSETPFRLTAAATAIRLGRNRRGAVRLALANAGTAAVRTRYDVQALPPAGPGWVSLDGSEFELAGSASQGVELAIAVPPDAAAGVYAYRVRAVDVDAPEDRVSEAVEIRIAVPAAAVDGPGSGLSTWGWIMLISGALAVAAIIVLLACGWEPGLVLLATALLIGALGGWLWWAEHRAAGGKP